MQDNQKGNQIVDENRQKKQAGEYYHVSMPRQNRHHDFSYEPNLLADRNRKVPDSNAASDKEYTQNYAGNSGNYSQKAWRKPTLFQTLAVIIGFPLLHIVVLNISFLLISTVCLLGQNTDLNSLDHVFNTLLSSDLQNYASVLMALICIPLYLLFLHYRKQKYQGSFLTHKLKLKPFLSSHLAVFGSLGLVSVLILFLEFIGGYLSPVQQWLTQYEELTNMIVSEDSNFLWQILGTVIFVPAAEELLFRGIVLGQLDLVLSPKIAILIQALLFGIFHMNPIQSLYTIIPGLLLGVIYYKTRNLIVPITGHMLFNFFGGVIYFIVPENISTVLNVAQIVIGVFSIVILFHFFMKEKPQNFYAGKFCTETISSSDSDKV